MSCLKLAGVLTQGKAETLYWQSTCLVCFAHYARCGAVNLVGSICINTAVNVATGQSYLESGVQG